MTAESKVAQAPLRVSVVVATYNRGPLLPTLLKGLENQTLPASEFEVILVDDGSKIPARAAVESSKPSFSLRLIEQENTGQAGARHRGVVEATGDVVVIVDDDMELAPDLLERHRNYHERGYRVVLGRILSAKHLADMPLFERFHAQQLERTAEAFRNGKRPRGVHLCTGNVSFRREDYLAIGGFDRNLKRSEDRELGVRLETMGAKFAFGDDASTVHDSDHVSQAVWLQRAFNYGVYDLRIHRKHPAVDNANPWRYFFQVSPISRPLLLLSAAAPVAGRTLSSCAWRVSEWLDHKGLERAAIRGATLVYGLEYFRGMREEAGSLRESAKDLLGYIRAHRRSRAVSDDALE